jgi:hypothetical protein
LTKPLAFPIHDFRIHAIAHSFIRSFIQPFTLIHSFIYPTIYSHSIIHLVALNQESAATSLLSPLFLCVVFSHIICLLNIHHHFSVCYNHPHQALLLVAFHCFLHPLFFFHFGHYLDSIYTTHASHFTMLPPTDSLQHQNLKLAEFISSAQITRAAPPAYSATSHETPALDQDQLADDDDDDDDDADDGYEYISSPPAPIKIKIDASLKIEGHANTIVLPSASPGPSPPTKQSAASSSSQPSYQNGRAERLTNMVLTALKDAGLLEGTQGTDSQATKRPIEVHVDAGIILKGSKNTVCSGLPKLIKPATGAGAVAGAAKVKTELERGEQGREAESQKRRACSVGANLTMKQPRKWAR